MQHRIRIHAGQAMSMILPYIAGRLRAQLKAVAFIVLYMALFQILILGIPVTGALEITAGVVVVIFGLACFLEGLLLGIMPLGETCGLKLPEKMPLLFILLFGLILGVGATFAEPAIAFLRQAGQSVSAWDAPLLFALLNRYATLLVLAIGAGVGVAVLFGVLRFLYNFRMRPFLLALVPILLGLTVAGWLLPGMRPVVDLAWDSGAITTGPVTVPLVLALGVGISRMTAKSENRLSGFGVVALASAFPIAFVLVLGMAVRPMVPAPMTEAQFLAPENRAQVALLFSDQRQMQKYVETQIGRPAGTAVSAMASADRADDSVVQPRAAAQTNGTLRETILSSGRAALQAIIPLSALLLLTIVVILRERLPRTDEIVLGVCLALVGLFLFDIGMDLGLTRLGRQTGGDLPASFASIQSDRRPVTIPHFDATAVETAVHSDGSTFQFFYLQDPRLDGGRLTRVTYDPGSYDASTHIYTYRPVHGPLFGEGNAPLGFAVVLLFAVLLGVSATLAEPSLSALGITVEDLTVGTFSRSALVSSVAAGVGIGMAVGFAKIIWDLPMVWLLVPIYALLLIMTMFSSEEFVTIAWDSAGVTTGPVTVPLVLATGTGISHQVGIPEGFGVLAMASAFPIMTVLFVGFARARRQTRAVRLAS